MGFDALDIDAPRHPEAAAWHAARRDRLPATWTHRTRSGGLHVLFEHRRGLRNWTGRPVPGIDGRGDGGYIVWWPMAGLAVECDAHPAPWPSWLLGEIHPQPLDLGQSRQDGGRTCNFAYFAHFAQSRERRSSPRYCVAALRDAEQRIAAAPLGSRNATLNREAYSIGRLVLAGGLVDQEAADALAAAAIAAGLPARETLATLGSAFRARGLL
jgi:hypothetical protein